MTTKAKAKADDEAPQDTSEAQSTETEQAPQCGKPHYLPALAHIACQEPAPDPDRPPGTPEHEHRHQDGDALYIWQ